MSTSREYIESGYTLVTSSNRIAHSLRYRYGQELLAEGKKVWRTPDIVSFPVWLERTWASLLEEPDGEILLNQAQELYVWQRIIRGSAYADKLLQLSGVARSAVEAWRLIKEYQLPLFSEGYYLNEDAYMFRSWARRFVELCDQNHWIVQADLASILTSFNTSALHTDTIAFIGFLNLTPQQNALFEHLRQSGIKVHHPKSDPVNTSVQVFSFKDRKNELHAVADWAADTFKKYPDKKTGVIVQNLRADRKAIEQVFSQTFSAQSLIDIKQAASNPYSISLGKPLEEYPVIHAVMTILKICQPEFRREDLSQFLLCPFIKGAREEAYGRARLDVSLRGHYATRYDLEDLLKLIRTKKSEKKEIQTLFDVLVETQKLLSDRRSTRTPQQWAALIGQVLDTMGWPGMETLNTQEYQAIDAWNGVMEQLMNLEIVASELGFQEMISQLMRILSDTGFQPETLETPIQILGASGAETLGYDYLWIMGMDEESYPHKINPNPFIPFKLQREHGLAHLVPSVRLAQAELQLSVLIQSSFDVSISYAIYEGDTERRPSALLNPYDNQERDFHDPMQKYLKDIFNSKDLEFYTDDQGPKFSDDEHVRGGTGIIKDQSACPFRAFARHRLGMKGFDQTDIGLSLLDRGLIAHDLMQVFWQKLKSHTELIDLTSGEELEMIRSSIDLIIKSYADRYPEIFTAKFTETEKLRLNNLLQSWIPLEKARTGFIVEELEKKHTVDFQGMTFTTRIDRIDKLADGSYAIIDYKTGSASTGLWAKERPEDPQLPFYVISAEKPVSCVAFAVLKKGNEMGFKGISRGSGAINQVKPIDDTRIQKQFGLDGPDWEELISNWNTYLANLVESFKSGAAMVDPIRAACQYCDLHTFCRVLDDEDIRS